MAAGIGPWAMAVDESLGRVYMINEFAYRLPPRSLHEGWLGRFVQMIPFVPTWADQGSGSIPGSVSIISVAR